MGMIERRDGLGFPFEAFRELSGRDLDRDVAAQARIVRLIHLTHSACTDGS
jgi:hypothetical protein